MLKKRWIWLFLTNYLDGESNSNYSTESKSIASERSLQKNMSLSSNGFDGKLTFPTTEKKEETNGMVWTKISNVPRKNRRTRTVWKGIDCFSEERKI